MGTQADIPRSGAMLKMIAFASILVQVAVFAALITETVIATSDGIRPARAAVVNQSECAKATWPNIPDHCLEQVGSPRSVKTLVLAAQN